MPPPRPSTGGHLADRMSRIADDVELLRARWLTGHVPGPGEIEAIAARVAALRADLPGAAPADRSGADSPARRSTVEAVRSARTVARLAPRHPRAGAAG